MGFSCIICSESLEKSYNPDPEPGEARILDRNDVNIMATPCGHVYHAYCIVRWMKGGQVNSKNCPNCRKFIPNKKCLPLFLDSYDFTLDASTMGLGDPSGTVAEIQEMLSSKSRKLDDLKDEHSALLQTFKAVSNENTIILDDLMKEKQKCENYLLKYQEASSYKTYAEQKESQCLKLQEELLKFKYVKALLQGVKIETDHDIKNFPPTSNSVHTLVQVKHILQQELDSSKNKINGFDKEREITRHEILKLKNKIKQLEDQNSELEVVLASSSSRKLPRIDHTKSDSKISSNRANSTTENHRKFDDLGKTIELVDSSSEEEKKNDCDVGILKELGHKPVDLRHNILNMRHVAQPNKQPLKLMKGSGRREKSLVETELSPLNMHVKSSIPGLGLGSGVPPRHRQLPGTSKPPNMQRAISVRGLGVAKISNVRATDLQRTSSAHSVSRTGTKF